MGYDARTRRSGSRLYLIAWAVVFPVQTIVVFSTTEAGSNDYLYRVFNALFLAGGLALDLLGSTPRERRIRVRTEAVLVGEGDDVAGDGGATLSPSCSGPLKRLLREPGEKPDSAPPAGLPTSGGT